MPDTIRIFDCALLLIGRCKSEMTNENRHAMSYNGEHYTVAANDIIRGKQSMTLQAARLIRLLIAQVVKEDKDLRKYFDCEDKYKLFADFKRKVIDIAVREINQKSDIWLSPTYKKAGRAVKSVVFTIHFQPCKKSDGLLKGHI